MQMFLGKSNQLPPTTRLLMKNLGRKYDFIQERATCVHVYVCALACTLICEYVCIPVCVHVYTCTLCMCQCVDMSLCVWLCVVYVYVPSSSGLGVQIIGFSNWSKLHAFSVLSFLICKTRRSDNIFQGSSCSNAL